MFLALSTANGGEKAKQPAPAPHPLAEAKLKAAQEAYRLHVERAKMGGSDSFNEEKWYQMSVRVLQSEQELSKNKGDRIAAFRAHCDRMTELEALAKRFGKAGAAAPERVASTRFFRLEAEIWLDRARAGKEKDREGDS
ncbi:MAG TPA: hypothetical protein VEL76_03390 [Gemmataceae bacterium]|nr:hypothetical protein [Gemmataceae bacterium]